jgi:hypothetical protein
MLLHLWRLVPPQNLVALPSHSSELSLRSWILPRAKNCMEMMLKASFASRILGLVSLVQSGDLTIVSWTFI